MSGKRIGCQRSDDNNWGSDEKKYFQIKISFDLSYKVEPLKIMQIKTVLQLQNLCFTVTASEVDLKE